MWDKIVELGEQLVTLRKTYYFHDVLFAYQWWILVIQTIILYYVWLSLVDKSRLRNILLVGALATVLALMLDNIGIFLGLWSYPYSLVYFLNFLNPIDSVLLPIGMMLVYQYFRKWIPYIMVLIVLSLFGSFVMEPLYVKLHMYVLSGWKHIYSFPIYIAIGVVVKGVTDGLEHLERKANKK